MASTVKDRRKQRNPRSLNLPKARPGSTIILQDASHHSGLDPREEDAEALVRLLGQDIKRSMPPHATDVSLPAHSRGTCTWLPWYVVLPVPGMRSRKEPYLSSACASIDGPKTLTQLLRLLCVKPRLQHGLRF